MQARARFALVTLTALAVAACSDSTDPDPEDGRDFTGSYTLVSFSQGTSSGVIQVPGATGSFVMTATRYDATVTVPEIIPGTGPTTVEDEGMYTANGTLETGTWTQESDDGSLQSTGTYTWDPATEQLTLDTISTGQRTVLVLQRT
jgi:hypothetical protein